MGQLGAGCAALFRFTDHIGRPVPLRRDPVELLRLARQADARAADLRRQATAYVLKAHSCGASWAEVGAAFGITRQAAHERFHGVNRLRRRAVRLSGADAESPREERTT
jgi:hypothetical protein